MKPHEMKEQIQKIKSVIESVIIGKSAEIDIVLSAFFAGGHVLLEDVPGTGKTMLSKVMAKTFALNFSRVQFTPDLLPTDIIGINFYNPQLNGFVLKKGAVFTNILLADEINRATPRTQSALLESMEERQVTIDGVSYPLEPPYFVIATQNPIETQGTFPLPEAQLDRFLVKLSLGYPSAGEAVKVLKTIRPGTVPDIKPVCGQAEIAEMMNCARNIYADDELIQYIVELTEATRRHEFVSLGVSVRGALVLNAISKAYAAINGRGFVIPDDIQYMAPYVFAHRLIVKAGLNDRNYEIVNEIVSGIKPPSEKWEAKP